MTDDQILVSEDEDHKNQMMSDVFNRETTYFTIGDNRLYFKQNGKAKRINSLLSLYEIFVQFHSCVIFDKKNILESIQKASKPTVANSLNIRSCRENGLRIKTNIKMKTDVIWYLMLFENLKQLLLNKSLNIVGRKQFVKTFVWNSGLWLWELDHQKRRL